LPPHTIETALGVTVIFAIVARIVRGVSLSGAIAGAVVSFVLYACAGPGAFLALVSVFVLTWIATRFGYSKKQKLGSAESREGRNARQVLANLSIAAICAALYFDLRNAVFLVAMSAALAEAAADTASSELGQAWSQNARLITSWKEVPAGTNGGVSVAGTLAGIVAAVAIAVVCLLAGIVSDRSFGIVVAAAFMGFIVDSFLGALLESRGALNNDQVNFLGTLIAAALGLLLAGSLPLLH